MQPHELHQHLVRVRRAIERAGSGSVVGSHLGLHQLVASNLSGGELLTDLGFLVIGQSAGHRSRRNEDAGDMTEGRRSDHEARHDLVADAKIERCVECVVRQGYAGRQRDDVARK